MVAGFVKVQQIHVKIEPNLERLYLKKEEANEPKTAENGDKFGSLNYSLKRICSKKP